jgi:DNA-binding NarL/FixJ family response regulator
VARIPLLTALIVDGRAALVCAESPEGRRATTVRDPNVVETLRILFDGIWRQAAVVHDRVEQVECVLQADRVEQVDRVDFGSPVRQEMARQILEWLRSGVSDEAAARHLSVPVRTYRRYVADIVVLLGAGSRFQAGMRAAELGLVPTEPRRIPPQYRR